MLGRALRYGVAGLFATLLYFGVAAGLVEMAGADPVAAAAAATVVVIVASYAVNRGWVFAAERSHASAFSRFLAASVLSLVLNAGVSSGPWHQYMFTKIGNASGGTGMTRSTDRPRVKETRISRAAGSQ